MFYIQIDKVASMKTIMISDDAYNKLSSLKGNRSFTEVISDLVERQRKAKYESIKKFLGVIQKEEADDLQESIKETRKRAKAHT